MREHGEGSAEKKKKSKKTEEEAAACVHDSVPKMEEKKRKQHKQSSQLHYGNVHIQDEGPEQERKKEPGGQEPLRRKKRKRDKSKQETEVAEERACTAQCAPNDGEQHVINGVTKQKTRRNILIAERSFDDDVGRLAQTQKKKKKKKRNDQGEHDPFCFDRAKDPIDLSNEDDMLFNFSMQPEATIVDHKKPQVSREQKTETFLVNDEILKTRKKKKKRDESEHNSLYSDRHKESTPRNDVVFNFVTQPHRAVENTVDYKSAVVATSRHANGSLREEKKRQDEAFIEQKQEKKEMTLVDIKTEGTPDKNRSLRKSSESPSRPTFSIAVAGSIVDNAQSLELATMLAGQIARAAAIFRVDEIVVFDDYDGESASNHQEDNSEEVGGLFMVRILKYLEVPQYLRRALIPMHRSLSSVGKLPPLDAPHHLRKHEWQPFREGVILGHGPLSGSGSRVDVGLEKEVVVGQKLKSGMRVTVAMGHTRADGDVLQVVDRETVRQAGFYWGYSVRYASCLSVVFDECPFEGKYDFCIGTSEHGEKLGPTDLVLPKCKHLLVVFGGLSGLEESVELDKRLQKRNVASLFHRYINTCSNQGSRTIRTEEAILISLQFLQEAVQQALSTT